MIISQLFASIIISKISFMKIYTMVFSEILKFSILFH